MIEANPRASRTVPFVSKAIGLPLAKVACRLMLGERLRDLDLPAYRPPRHVSVKEAVLPFERFPRRRLAARSRDEVHGRGDGRRRRLPGRVRQGAGGGGLRAARAPARSSSRSPTATSRPPPSSPPASTTWASASGHRRHGTGHPAHGGPVERIKKISEGSPNVVDRIEARRGRPRDQHAHRLGGARGRLRDPPRGRGPRYPLHHHDVGGQRRPARDPRRRASEAEVISLQELHAAPPRSTARRPRAVEGPRERATAAEPRTLAPPERRVATVTGVERAGRLRRGARPRPGAGPPIRTRASSTCSPPRRAGAGGGRPALPAARVLPCAGPATPGGVELSFLLEEVGPGTRRLASWRRATGSRSSARSGVGFRPPARRHTPAARGRRHRRGTAALPSGRARRAGRRCALGFRSAEHARAAALFERRGRPWPPTTGARGARARHRAAARRARRRRRATVSRLRAAADARGGAGALRRARRAGPAGARVGHGLWLRRVLRLRRPHPGGLPAPVLGRAGPRCRPLETALVPGAGH